MLQAPLALAEIPAEEEEAGEDDVESVSTSSESVEQHTKRLRVDQSESIMRGVGVSSASTEPAASFVITNPAVSEHERILAEFCLNEEDNADVIVSTESTIPMVLPSAPISSVSVGTIVTAPVRANTFDIDRNWGEKMAALLRYGREKGTYDAAFDATCTLQGGIEFKLGAWVFRQKALKLQNGLAPEREAQFDELVKTGKFSWGISHLLDQSWYENYEMLMEYFAENGHCNPPWSYTCSKDGKIDTPLGEWVHLQRQLKRDNNLSGEYDILISCLVERGLLKLVGKDEKQDIIWDMKFEALEKFAYANGHCNIKTGKHMCILADGTEANIGTWLNTQRGLKRKDMLREDKHARMQALVDKGYLSWNCKRSSADSMQSHGNSHGMLGSHISCSTNRNPDIDFSSNGLTDGGGA